MIKKDLCIFCGKDASFGEMNREHYVAKCFWSGARPSSTKVAPAHISCNSKSANDSEYLRDVLCAERGAEEHPEVLRLLHGPIKRKWKKRRGKLLKMLDTAKLRPVVSSGGLYLGHSPSFIPDWPRMQTALKTVVRGIFYTATGEPMPPDFNINVGDVSCDVSPALQQCIDNLPKQWQSFGDDVFLCRYLIDNQYRGSMACEMQFYQRRSFFAFAFPPNFGVRNDGTIGFLDVAN